MEDVEKEVRSKRVVFWAEYAGLGAVSYGADSREEKNSPGLKKDPTGNLRGRGKQHREKLRDNFFSD